MLDEQGLQRLLAADGSQNRNSDGNLQLEFRAARHLYAIGEDQPTRRSVIAAARSDWFVGQFRQLGCEKRQAIALHELAAIFSTAGLLETAAPLIAFGLSQDPQHPRLLADQLLVAPFPDGTLLDRLLAIPDASVPLEATRVGRGYLQNQQYAPAVAVFRRLCDRFPGSSTSWVNLALSYYGAGNADEARQALQRALELDPANEQGLRASTMLRSAIRPLDDAQ